jgi:hypothetical protein
MVTYGQPLGWYIGETDLVNFSKGIPKTNEELTEWVFAWAFECDDNGVWEILDKFEKFKVSGLYWFI